MPFPPPANNKQQQERTVKRVFLPGDEWLYFKIYGSPNTIDELLQSPVRQLTRKLLRQGIVKSFFFLRYADPDHHLRIRFRLTENNQSQQVITTVQESMDKYLRRKKIASLQIDTYTREIERYGANNIERSESFFFNDSKSALEILSLLQQQSEELRWQTALLGIDAWLNDFGLDLPQKITVITSLQKRFFEEFGGSQPLLHSLNDKYRMYKNKLFHLFNNQELPETLLKCKKILRQRSVHNKPLVNELHNIGNRQQDITYGVLDSYLHMFIIRLFTAENRKYELTLYHLLMKYYTATSAIQKQTPGRLQ